MESELAEVTCLKCGFEHATHESKKNAEQKVFCCRCGFFMQVTADIEKSVFPAAIVWKQETGGGKGSFICKCQKGCVCSLGPVDRDMIKGLKADLAGLTSCKYTFKKNSQWFIKDLLTHKRMPFSHDRFHA